MNDLSDEDQKGVLGEVLNDQLKAILEGVNALPTRKEFQRLEEKVDQLDSDMQVVKAAIKNQSTDLRDYKLQVTDHEQRITSLEQAA